MIDAGEEWASLPQDVVTRVCKYLDHDSIGSMRCTCKAWAAAPSVIDFSTKMSVGMAYLLVLLPQRITATYLAH